MLYILRPPFSYDLQVTVILIRFVLPPHKNLNKMSMLCWSCTDGSGKLIKRYIILDIISVFINVILPIGVKWRFLYIPISPLISFIVFIKFQLTISPTSVENVMPNTLKVPGSHTKFLSLINTVPHFALLPIQIICVFSSFTFKPDMALKESSTLNALRNESSEQSIYSIVSSANNERSVSSSLVLIPLILPFFLNRRT